jgi:hypothetical protein
MERTGTLMYSESVLVAPFPHNLRKLVTNVAMKIVFGKVGSESLSCVTQNH